MRLILFSQNCRNSNWDSGRLNNLMEVTGKRATLVLVKCVAYTWGDMILYAPKEKLVWSDNPKVFHGKWFRRERKQMKGSSVEVYMRHMRRFSEKEWLNTMRFHDELNMILEMNLSYIGSEQTGQWPEWVQVKKGLTCINRINIRPGEFHWQYSPWDRKESDMTEWLSLILTYLYHLCL